MVFRVTPRVRFPFVDQIKLNLLLDIGDRFRILAAKTMSKRARELETISIQAEDTRGQGTWASSVLPNYWSCAAVTKLSR